MTDRVSSDDITPPFSEEDEKAIQEALDQAGIKLKEHFSLPQGPVADEPGKRVNPAVPEGRIKENYNGQRGDGTFSKMDFPWQPDCDQEFAIVISEVWTPPPAGLAGKFWLWAGFAFLRAILICRRSQRCRRVIPLGCESTWEVQFANGTVYCRARFVFICSEI
ncbi:hypothetical protein [Microbulbifer sp. YPW1]|uniref:hypothetical protein n=1 Tax=Microbulbifer sp. YPW1 TaxID=2745199 RepID=UPI00159B4C84|nr:hypothetical protein [Microbulbifer sp. YPW1]QKX16333.1 hypothetical protein HUW35_04650 [Microbulbifer sp. YPW1]